VLEDDPEKWTPVSRLREAWAMLIDWPDASAGEGRSEEIMLQLWQPGTDRLPAR
jgi:hypothetical protein